MAKKRRYFVTGATGCIGSWVVKNLVEAGHDVYALARGGKLSKLSLIMDEESIAKINVVQGDLCDKSLVADALTNNRIDSVIHLAAMQMPLCHNDPVLGAQVNVAGTVNILEAARAAGIDHIVYSSSTAVYGNIDEYPDGLFDNSSAFIPHSHYGVYKIANELSAKVYFEKYALSSVALRPFVVYGPLRDQGMTSTPTAAMKRAARGEGYEISFGGRFGFQYVDDVARAFIKAADVTKPGAYATNLGGYMQSITDVINAIEKVVPEVAGQLTFIDKQLEFPIHAKPDEAEALLGKLQWTPLEIGVRRSIEMFRAKPQLVNY